MPIYFKLTKNPLSITYFTPVLYPEKTYLGMSLLPPASLKYLESAVFWIFHRIGEPNNLDSRKYKIMKTMTIYGIPEIWFPLSKEFFFLVSINSILVRIRLHFSCLNNRHPDGLKWFTAIIMFVETLSCLSCFPFLKENQISDHQQQCFNLFPGNLVTIQERNTCNTYLL